jgi:hypothetical protein
MDGPQVFVRFFGCWRFLPWWLAHSRFHFCNFVLLWGGGGLVRDFIFIILTLFGLEPLLVVPLIYMYKRMPVSLQLFDVIIVFFYVKHVSVLALCLRHVIYLQITATQQLAVSLQIFVSCALALDS